jgi:hypothetical protein
MRCASKLFVIICVLSAIGNINKADGAFQFSDFSARGNGLGGAFVALANDNSAPLYNPAGLRQVRRKNLLLSYLKPYLTLPDINLNFLHFNFTCPLPRVGNLGLSCLLYTADKYYSEYVFLLNYAARLSDFFPDISFHTLAGINIKILGHSYSWDEEIKAAGIAAKDPIIVGNKTQQSAVSFDLGFLTRIVKNLYFGFSVNDIIQPNVGLVYEDRVPLTIRTGISLREPLSLWYIRELVINCDISYRNQSWGKWSDRLNFYVGNEISIPPKILLRYGINLSNFSLGGSYIFKTKDSLQLRIDYSLLFPLHFSYRLETTHNIALSCEFGKLIEDVEPAKEKIKEKIIEEIFEEKEEKKEEKLKAPSIEEKKEVPLQQPQPQQQQKKEMKKEKPAKQEKKIEEKELKKPQEEELLKNLLEEQ